MVFSQLGRIKGLSRELSVRLAEQEKEYSAGLVGEAILSVLALQLIGLPLIYLAISSVSSKDASVKRTLILTVFSAFAGAFAQIVMLRLRTGQRILGLSSLPPVNTLRDLVLDIFGFIIWIYKSIIIAIMLRELIIGRIKLEV